MRRSLLNMSDFSEYQPFDTPISFNTADASNMILALGKGTVRGNTWVDGDKVPIALTHVYYIPKLRGRIFSTGTIERNGYSLVQGDGKMCMMDIFFVFQALPAGLALCLLLPPSALPRISLCLTANIVSEH